MTDSNQHLHVSRPTRHNRALHSISTGWPGTGLHTGKWPLLSWFYHPGKRINAPFIELAPLKWAKTFKRIVCWLENGNIWHVGETNWNALKGVSIWWQRPLLDTVNGFYNFSVGTPVEGLNNISNEINSPRIQSGRHDMQFYSLSNWWFSMPCAPLSQPDTTEQQTCQPTQRTQAWRLGAFDAGRCQVEARVVTKCVCLLANRLQSQHCYLLNQLCNIGRKTRTSLANNRCRHTALSSLHKHTNSIKLRKKPALILIRVIVNSILLL